MTLLDALQQINRQGMDAAQLTDMCVGTVVAVNPLEIEMDVHQAPLTGDVLVLTDAVRGGGGGESFFADVNGILCAVWGQSSTSSATSDLTVGEKVLMLSVRHGQKFIVLSRL